MMFYVRKLLGRASEQLGLRANLTVEIFDAHSLRRINVIKSRNKVPLVGRNAHRDMLGGTGFEPTHIALGTNTAAPADSDTVIIAGEVFRKAIDRRIGSASKMTFQLFLTTAEANGTVLADARLLNSAILLNGDLYARALLVPTIDKSSSLSATFTWDYSYTSL